jgi:hypothetical protein
MSLAFFLKSDLKRRTIDDTLVIRPGSSRDTTGMHDHLPKNKNAPLRERRKLTSENEFRQPKLPTKPVVLSWKRYVH